jgi:hypothetical protein
VEVPRTAATMATDETFMVDLLEMGRKGLRESDKECARIKKENKKREVGTGQQSRRSKK